MSSAVLGEKGPLVLEHFRGETDTFGLRSRSTGRAATVQDLSEQITRARSGGQPLDLVPRLVNPDPGAALRLARALRSHGRETRICRAVWRPRRPHTPAIADLLRRADVVEVEIPSASARARRYYRDPPTLQDVVRGVEWLRGERIEPVVKLWLGVPGEDEIGLLETLRRAYSLRPRRIELEELCAEPGSFFHERRRRLQLTIETEPPFRIQSHRWANALELRWFAQIATRSTTSYNYWTRMTESQRSE